LELLGTFVSTAIVPLPIQVTCTLCQHTLLPSAAGTEGFGKQHSGSIMERRLDSCKQIERPAHC
jgi:hypothetical protein